MEGDTNCEQNGCSAALLVEQSPYLKPPNFLNLIYDPNNHATYSGPSALSPIKECSSNLSYASSQSSLNNANQAMAQQHRNLSMYELQATQSSSTTITTTANSVHESGQQVDT